MFCINFVRGHAFVCSIGFWKCSDSVVFFFPANQLYYSKLYINIRSISVNILFITDPGTWLERLSIYLYMFNELIILTIDDIYSLRRSNKHQTYLNQFHEVPIYTYFNSESVHRYTVSISKITNDMFVLC